MARIMMHWNNLKSYKCPKCSFVLARDEDNMMHRCVNPQCRFIITDIKFQSIVASKYNRGDAKTEDNSSALNNLGHDKVREDFSDSNALDY